ncbi:pyridoxal phosphate-dependent class II aminotransferase [Pseudooceanicola sp. CBS1P-1]|uniref:Aminotransferase n=1 Tax=Pseudooceanicola albus TaxID=2692189 RepID=A0A6L7G232_9RHOB|nr:MULTISPECIES: threonine-phosphate decarboxylase [Pseudooceanicola]MBT9384733.1 pyridoxal phosphate-dependent class II aminotransferase [Pseudooceanicola endophyticus]MXN18434.1 aminotransferase class I/II-fold pyridoxal phosphate-dependent enzyme [Pseudooceanicola albus]
MARDHGGNLAAAQAAFGGAPGDWCDLSTGINPVPYPLPAFAETDWTALPDAPAQQALLAAARRFWDVPEGADILAVPGCSAAIARMPGLMAPARVQITGPTYNEHAAAFRAQGWEVCETEGSARVLVHPNNPTGAFHAAPGPAALTILDESFCDIAPEQSLIHLATRPDVLVLKSFGKFWGLAGLRLGFVIGTPARIAALSALMGPWAVSGPALRTGRAALSDPDWAAATRARLMRDAARLDALVTATGATLAGGTPLFRLYDCADAQALQQRLARARIWSRIFPYSTRWIRLGLPAPDRWAQLEKALA